MFEDRADAGKQLLKQLKEHVGKAIVLALPRGGVAVGYEIAKGLHIPLSVIISRKLGAPYNPELGIGAIAEGNNQVLDKQIIKALGIFPEELARIRDSEQKEIKRRVDLYRNGKPLPNLAGKTVILVDDGLATGVTARVAIEAIRKKRPKRLIFAVPVCASDTVELIKKVVDKFICLHFPYDLQAIGMYYKDFKQMTDSEVLILLNRIKKKRE